MTRAEYEAAVERAKEYIYAGDIFQVVPSQRWTGPCPVEPFSLYRGLRVVNPSPYMYFLEFDDFAIAGASPEPLREGRAAAAPRCGRSRARARARRRPEEDLRVARELLEDEKERAEHVMLVDLGRNDLGRVCEFGSVEVERADDDRDLLARDAHRLVGVGHAARRDCGAMDALRACLPAGTLSGAPKIRAMEIIDELEPVEARLLRRRDRLSELLGRPRHLHPHPHGRGQGRRRPHPGRRPASWPTPIPAYEYRETRRQGEARCSGRSSWRAAQGEWAVMRVLVIDNYDSFTYNLVQYLGELGARAGRGAQRPRHRRRAARARRRPRRDLARARAGRSTPASRSRPRAASPRRASRCSACASATRRWRRRSAAGSWSASPCTARPPRSRHDGSSIFRDVENPLVAGRYHSLVVDPDLPDELELSAESDGTVMGIRHRELPAEGVQFHPESVLTESGKRILRNFLESAPPDAERHPHRGDRRGRLRAAT